MFRLARPQPRRDSLRRRRGFPELAEVNTSLPLSQLAPDPSLMPAPILHHPVPERPRHQLLPSVFPRTPQFPRIALPEDRIDSAAITMSSDVRPLEKRVQDVSRVLFFKTHTGVEIYIRNKVDFDVRTSHLRMKPVLCYVMETAQGAAVTTAHRAHGIDHHILEHYAPHSRWLLNTYQALVIPSSFYWPDSWPYEDALRDGRPFTTIIEWLRAAYSDASDKHYVKIPLIVDELCAYLYACKILGMQSAMQQIEHVLLNILRYRALNVREIKAIWSYHKNSVHSNPDLAAHLRIRAGFTNNAIMPMFAQNLRTLTSAQWRYDDTGKFNDERAEYASFLAGKQDLLRLMYSPNLKSYVTMIEPNADRVWKEKRFADWIADNQYHFDIGRVYPMPPIEESHIEESSIEESPMRSLGLLGTGPPNNWHEIPDFLW